MKAKRKPKFAGLVIGPRCTNPAGCRGAWKCHYCRAAKDGPEYWLKDGSVR